MNQKMPGIWPTCPSQKTSIRFLGEFLVLFYCFHMLEAKS
ncbi:hypothetical protein ART_2231 [Arthrobacter sp. PAMC 25486]|nr:hypothetical protein ART_2231 [Arthrobacter sp. PAMC 25486]